MDLFTLHNCRISCSLDYLKSKLEYKGRLPILEFYGSHCTKSANPLFEH